MDIHLPANSFVPQRVRGPVAVWVLIALIGVVLGGASLASALTTDSRDFAARHVGVLKTTAL
jgi:hypothetical protein